MEACIVVSASGDVQASASAKRGADRSSGSSSKERSNDHGNTAPIQVWDPVTGGSLVQFKNSSGAVHGLAAVGGEGSANVWDNGSRNGCDYILASQVGRGSIYSWSWGRHQPHFKSPMSELIGPICTTKSGTFCFGGGTSGRIYVWDVSTGELLKQFQAHYKAVKVLRLTSDDSSLVSGGGDSIINVWNVVELVDVTGFASSISRSVKPMCSWNGHALPITDLFCSQSGGGINGHVWSASMDHTCKVWSILNNTVLKSISFPAYLSAIVADPEEKCLYAGGGDGKIYIAYIKTLASSITGDGLTYGLDSSSSNGAGGNSREKRHTLVGHNGRINCLAMAIGGSVLISGGQDGVIILWDVASRLSTKRLSFHDGPVTSLLVMPRPADLFKLKHAKASGDPSRLAHASRGVTLDNGKGKQGNKVNQPRPIAPFRKHMESKHNDYSIVCTLPIKASKFMSAKSFGGIRGKFGGAKARAHISAGQDPISAQEDMISLAPLPQSTAKTQSAEVQRLKEEIVQLKQQNERWQRVALELQDMVGEEAVVDEAGGRTGQHKPKKRRKKR